MLNRLKKLKSEKPNQGFTIIEVMIVLAIAGLILLIVFLAVPALQRSARNTQRKNDAAQIAAAIASYIDDNGGTLPESVGSDSTNSIDICGANCNSGNTETAKLGYYANTTNIGGAISLVYPGSSTPGTPTPEEVIIDDGYTCNSTSTGVGTASPRSAVVLYATETGGSGTAEQCVEQ